MKLAFAHYSYQKDISGVTTWLQRLILRLHGDGIPLAVHLLHFGDDHKRGSILPPLERAGIDVEVTPISGIREIDVRKTLAFLDRTEPTLFLPHCLKSHYVAAGIAGQQGLPWAFTIHSDDPHYWSVASCVPPLRNGGRAVVVSEHLARLVSESGLDKQPQVIPYGVESSGESARFTNNPFRVVYSGRLVEEQKRLSLVISTMIRACKANPRICATVIGEGPAMPVCQQTVAKAKLSHRIHFIGRLAPEKVKEELLKAQAILLMSDFEGLPVSLLEGMSVGVVPVVRAIPSGIPELVQHERTGLLVEDHPDSAAQGISRLASTPGLWQSCSVSARQLVREKYSEDACYRRWLEFLDDLHSKSKVQYPLQVPAQIAFPAEGNAGSSRRDEGICLRTALKLKDGFDNFRRIFRSRGGF